MTLSRARGAGDGAGMGPGAHERNNPPSKPQEIRARAGIDTFRDDICSRAMTHKIEATVAQGDRLAFPQACAYPDGGKVYWVSMLELAGGGIARETVVQARDE